MKIYVDENEISKTITYRETEEGARQYLFVHDKEGFIIKNLEELQNQKAIECLKDMYDYIIENGILKDVPNFYGYHILSEYMDNKIKELEGENETL